MTDFVIVLRTNDAVKTFCGDAHISIGAGVSAAIGIIGRTAGADMRAGASGSTACYTYSSSKGYLLSKYPTYCVFHCISAFPVNR